jgi:hypothetical protein
VSRREESSLTVSGVAAVTQTQTIPVDYNVICFNKAAGTLKESSVTTEGYMCIN